MDKDEKFITIYIAAPLPLPPSIIGYAVYKSTVHSKKMCLVCSRSTPFYLDVSQAEDALF